MLRVRVRVVRVLNPAPVGPSDVTLSASARFVGVEISIANLSQVNFDESPLADSMLLTNGGSTANTTRVLGGPCGGGFASHVKIAPGGERSGCVTFEVPRGKRPAEFRFALDAGLAPQAGTWKLK